MLPVKFGNLFDLSTCILNASGPRCTELFELQNLMKCQQTAGVISKSCTLASRVGNPHPRYYEDQSEVPLYTINSTGLANRGIDHYLEASNTLKMYDTDSIEQSDPCSKPYIISVAGLSQQENLEIFDKIEQKMITESCDIIDAVELNLSCPNIVGKPQVGYDFEASRELLRKIHERNNRVLLPYLGLKLPPYFDLTYYDKMAEIINEFKIDFITCINSIGNGLIIDVDTESVVIKPKKGFGGIGGSLIKPVALANVNQFHHLLPDLPIFGCGGVRTGSDVFEHLLAGASAVQIGSQYMIEDVQCFARLEQELLDLMTKKGYNNVAEFQGKLKDM